MVDELTRAVEALAAKKMGAIIIVARDARLNEHVNSGIQIDARVSTPMLVQLFTSPGPTHDGAAIIRDGRIAAAGVFLPLTQNPRIDSSLGTRHRAAIGISEEKDAIALVVSEETGKISFVEHGRLTRDLDAAMLRQVLNRHIGPTKPSATTDDLAADDDE